MELFEKSSYVGYTATPFANVLIDPDAIDTKGFLIKTNDPNNYN